MNGLHATMQAVCLRRVPQGVPQAQDFELRQLPLPALGDGQLRVQVQWLSLDPFLRAQLGGRYAVPCPPLGSIVPGYGIGTVAEDRSGRFAVGDVVSAMTGWAEQAVLDASVVSRVDATLAPISTAVGVLGIPGLTAWAGVRHILEPRAGQTILVSTAAGAVGSVVGQLCKAAGCRVIGIAGSARKCAIVIDEYGFDACVNYRDADFLQTLRSACPDGIDGYFDNVGGAVLEAALSLLKLHARVVLCGLSDQYNSAERPAGPNLGPVIGARARLEGLVVYDHLADFNRCRSELSRMIADGTLRYREHIHDGLANAPAGFIGLLNGDNLGKALVRL
ncbi:NADP-dependent oxidoreductase [Stenotrophomonas sp. Iso1]|uniref:NADP-dependent oxidoreductase n=1 Tax=Stenotrophomonas sp. Iso1 TaxID=2977283 RepID=UPI0022B7D2E8|nr:NADP-dependent oxidoreductase [Stenotrophomonas sp. Iso1]